MDKVSTPITNPNASGCFCAKHGGNLSIGDVWLCDICARQGIDVCSCGSPARVFGEAMLSSVSCESCNQFVAGVDVGDIRLRWNRGERGFIVE